MSMTINGWDHDKWINTDPKEIKEPVCSCEQCGKDLYEGDTAYDIGDIILCERCIDHCRFIVEEDER